jgi:hypothetical protein
MEKLRAELFSTISQIAGRVDQTTLESYVQGFSAPTFLFTCTEKKSTSTGEWCSKDPGQNFLDVADQPCTQSGRWSQNSSACSLTIEAENMPT